MRLARHPVAHALPPVLFLVLLLGFTRLQQQPYLSALLPAAAVSTALALVLYVDAKARLRNSHYHHDVGEDTDQVYFNQDLHPIQKIMFMEERTGCMTVLVALGYLIISLLLV